MPDVNTPFRIDSSTIQTDSGHNKGYLAIIHGAVSTDHQCFQVLVDGPDCHLHKTRKFAKHHDCIYAVNGGPFKSYVHGGCIGDIITNGKHIIKDGGDYLAFGITQEQEWFIGNYASSSSIELELNDDNDNDIMVMRDLVTGLGTEWLLKDGRIAIFDDDTSEVAPRTAIGVTNKGKLVILQVDGCEHCLNAHQRGITLQQLAELMLSSSLSSHLFDGVDDHHLIHAINLDGGGCSTTVVNGKTVNHPTCLDYTALKCERPVASVICIKEPPTTASPDVVDSRFEGE